jgi:anti-sigma factor RsiW
MPNCQAIDSLVTPFVDGQLPEEERRRVEAHLRLCPPCHSRVVAERAVFALVQARRPALHGPCAPRALHAACAEIARRMSGGDVSTVEQSAIHNQSAISNQQSAISNTATPKPWSSRMAPYALAASLVLGVGGAFVYQATDRSARVMAAELTADHMKCLALNSALGTHESAAAVESSMLSSFDWHMHLPSDPSRAGLELVGARPCLYGEGKIAHIMYRHDGHPVSLFMLPRSARPQQLVEVLGHEAAIWCAGNRTFVLIAREPRKNVERLASFVQASMR